MKMLARYFTPDDKAEAFLLGGLFVLFAAMALPLIPFLVFALCYGALAFGYGIYSAIRMMRRDA